AVVEEKLGVGVVWDGGVEGTVGVGWRMGEVRGEGGGDVRGGETEVGVGERRVEDGVGVVKVPVREEVEDGCDGV
uniref:hypothetical protein n=1 Tax=Corynebacterium glyciniphilum TaxID=1404244 RepID=UPI001C92C67E